MQVLERLRSRHPQPSSARPVRLGRWLSSGLHDSGLALAVLGLTIGAVIAAQMLAAPTVLVFVIAALPILVIIGARHALVLLPVALIARALVDNLELQIVTAGIAVALIGLALVVSWRSASWLLVLVVCTGYLLLSAAAGAPRFGAAVTYGEMLRLISALAVVLIVMNAPGRLTAVGIARSVQAIGALPAAVAIYQGLTGNGTYIDGVLRASGTLAQANSAAVLFALCNVASFALVYSGGPRRVRNASLFALFIGAQLATGSVGGAVTCLVMIVVHLLSLRSTRIERTFLAILAIALAGYLAAISAVGSRRLSEFTGPNADPLSGENSLGWRLNAWEKVLDAWRAHPLFGNGVGITQGDLILAGSIPHNEYVRLLAEVGIFGLVAVLALGLVYGIRMLRAVALADDFAPPLALAVFAGSLVNALAANTMLYSVSFYTSLFVLAGCWRVVAQARAVEPSARAKLLAQLGSRP